MKLNSTTSPPDSYLSVAKGLISSYQGIIRNGYASSVSTSYVTVWSANILYTYLSAAQILVITSSDANDTSAGTGARTILITGLDTNYAVVNETVTMNGTSNVNSVNSFLRIINMEVVTAGSSNINAGAITAKYSGTTYGQIPASIGSSLMSLYTIPAGKTGYLLSIEATGSSGKSAILDLFYRPFGESFKLKQRFNVYQNHIDIFHQVPISFSAKTDFEFRAISDASGTAISTVLNLLLIDN